MNCFLQSGQLAVDKIRSLRTGLLTKCCSLLIRPLTSDSPLAARRSPLTAHCLSLAESAALSGYPAAPTSCRARCRLFARSVSSDRPLRPRPLLLITSAHRMLNAPCFAPPALLCAPRVLSFLAPRSALRWRSARSLSYSQCACNVQPLPILYHRDNLLDLSIRASWLLTHVCCATPPSSSRIKHITTAMRRHAQSCSSPR